MVYVPLWFVVSMPMALVPSVMSNVTLLSQKTEFPNEICAAGIWEKAQSSVCVLDSF